MQAIRRTTIVVEDIDTSLTFYRDILGLEVFYDGEIGADATGKLLGVDGARVRIVSMKGEDTTFGMVGLMQYITPEIKPRRSVVEMNLPADIVLIFRTTEIHRLHEAFRDAGMKIQCPPVRYEIPGRGMVTGMSVFDHDGILIELSQHE